jgi:hypothetical protein
MNKLEAKKNKVISNAEAVRKSIKADELLEAFREFKDAQDIFSTAAATNIDVETRQFPFKNIPYSAWTNEQKELSRTVKTNIRPEREASQKSLREAQTLVRITTETLEKKLKEYSKFVKNPADRIELEGLSNLLRLYKIHVVGKVIFPNYMNLRPNTYTWTRKNNVGNKRANIAARKTRPREYTLNEKNVTMEHISLNTIKKVLIKTLPEHQARTIAPVREVEGENLASFFNESVAPATKPCNKGKEGCSIMGGSRKTHKKRN